MRNVVNVMIRYLVIIVLIGSLAMAMAVPELEADQLDPDQAGSLLPADSHLQRLGQNAEYSNYQSELESCGLRLANLAGVKKTKVPTLIRRHSAGKDLLFLKYALAVVYVESRFVSNTKSDRDAYGLMQVTEDAVADLAAPANCALPRIPMDLLYDPVTNIRYGTCYLRKALREVDGDWTRALIVYNGGYRQLLRYDSGKAIAGETANYIIQVNRALQICSSQDQVAH